MKYRVESVVYSDISREWSLLTEYTDNRDAAKDMSIWLNFYNLIGHYGVVINQETGEIEYEFSSCGREMLDDLWKHIDEVIIRRQKEEET